MPIATADTTLVLDNDLFSHWRNRHQYIEEALRGYFSYHQQYPALASITVFESLSGFMRDEAGNVDATVRDKFTRVQQLMDELIVLPFDLRAAQIAAAVYKRIPANLRKDLTKDLFIAASALANGCGVATGNRKDFELIESLLPSNLGPLYLAIWR